RPVTMVEQHLDSNIQREEEFCFGDKLLVSPVLNPGQQRKKVYLPQGTWYDYWDNVCFEGGKEYEVDTPIDRMPIFVKAGAVMPEYPVMQYVHEKRIESLKLLVYYTDRKTNSYLYEDHGDTFAYEQHIYLEKKFVVKGNDKGLTVEQHVDGLYSEKYDTYDLHLVALPFRSEEHTFELQSRENLVCRLLLEKK